MGPTAFDQAKGARVFFALSSDDALQVINQKFK
jgi:hypothetical protein